MTHDLWCQNAKTDIISYMSIRPICDFCKKELTDFGGLVFSPPENTETGNTYRVIGVGKHTETLEDFVIYESQYENTTSKIWVRPAKMFTELVLIEGSYVPRFVFLSDTL